MTAFVALAFVVSVQAQLSAEQHGALMQLYTDLNCSHPRLCPRFNATAPCSASLDGRGAVVCDGKHVLRIDISGVMLVGGTLSTMVGLLTGLTELSVQFAGLGGSLPSQMGSLTALTSLSLLNNSIGGSIVTQLGRLTKLQSLVLGVNQLQGTIVSELALLTMLTALSLRRNRLVGGVPPLPTSIQALGCSLQESGDANCLDCATKSLSWCQCVPCIPTTRTETAGTTAGTTAAPTTAAASNTATTSTISSAAVIGGATGGGVAIGGFLVVFLALFCRSRRRRRTESPTAEPHAIDLQQPAAGGYGLAPPDAYVAAPVPDAYGGERPYNEPGDVQAPVKPKF